MVDSKHSGVFRPLVNFAQLLAQEVTAQIV
jgi:hypothetical protein